MKTASRFLALVFVAFCLPGAALAQFDDEFEDFEEPEAAPAAAPVAETTAADPFDEFDDFEEPVVVTPETAGDPPAENTEEPASEEEDPDPRDHFSDRHRLRLGNTLFGTTGGIRIPHALGAPAGTFRVQLALEFMAKNGFLFPDDEHSRVGGALSLSWAVHQLVEVYASLWSYATSNNSEFPNLLIVLGDVQLGAKVGIPLNDVTSLGGDVGFILPTGTGLGPAFGSMGLRLRANATIDLRGRPSPTPFIARFSAGYTFDRSEKLIAADEDRRYERLPDATVREEETRHLITRAERNALSIDRTDFFNLGIGFEIPIEIGDEMMLSPMLEYALDIPVNRQGYVCPFVPAAPGADVPRPGDDDCLERVGFSAFPQRLTLGARFLPPVRGLGILAALDIGLTGRTADSAVRELSQTAPWKLWIGVGYAYDARAPQIPPPIIREVEREVEVDNLGPGGRIRGRVLETEGEVGIGSPTIRFQEPEMTALRGDGDGRFTTYRFPPGTVRMSIEAPGHATGVCEATIPEEGGDQDLVCRLARTLVEVEDNQVVILEQIQFAFDSAEILSESFELMDQIAGALRDHPEIRMVEIQGHTDDQGDDQYNATLSQRRAESVQAALVERGIEAARLQARGYGELRPLVRLITEEARARNRRVEFRILERTE